MMLTQLRRIAAWCAMQGMLVTLSDQEVEPLGKTVRKTVALYQDQHKSRIETRQVLDRLIPDVKNTGMAKADRIIEAVPENIDIKHKVY